MKQMIPIREYLENKSQTELASELGVSQGAIHQMLKSNRDIYVVLEGDGKVRAIEHRPIPARKNSRDEAA